MVCSSDGNEQRRATSESTRALRIVSIALAAVFLWSGFIKFIDPDAFGFAIWKIAGGLVGPEVAVWAGGFWAVVEVIVAIVLLRSFAARWVYQVVLFLGVFFLLVLVRLLTMTDPPGCGCLSIASASAGRVDQLLGLIRVAGLPWLAWIGLRLSPSHARSVVGVRPVNAGFTLIETLVVVSIIVLLVGLLLPSLEGMYFSSKQTRQAIRQRETYSAVMAYIEDYKNTLPYFGTVGDPYGPITIDGVVFEDSNYFSTPNRFWASVLVPEYVPERSMLESRSMTEGLAALGMSEVIIGAESVLTGTAYAAPKFFHDRDQGEALDFSQFRATRRFEMIFPSDKVLLISWWGGGGNPDFATDDSFDYPATFGDGSTTWFSYDELIAMPTALVPFGGAIPTHTTYNGISGRDR